MPREPFERLKLFTTYLPRLTEWYAETLVVSKKAVEDKITKLEALQKLGATEYHDYDEGQSPQIFDEFVAAWDAMRFGTVFDCRSLPIDFVLDSGDDYPWDRNWLPYQECYFEFADGTAIVAWQQYEAEAIHRNTPPVEYTTVDDIPYDPSDPSAFFGPEDADGTIRMPAMAGITGVLSADPKDMEFTTDKLTADEEWLRYPHELLRRGSVLLKGLVCLLTEKLVLDRIQSDRMPHLNKARVKKGKLPLDVDHHVLTLYVPGIEYAVSHGSKEGGGGTHASPVLHWRRGHVRTLRRGTGSQSQTSVRRHLVGDPDKGFIKHSYRLVPRPSALSQDDADE